MNSPPGDWQRTSLSGEEVEDPAGLAPAEPVPRLHEALVLRVLAQTADLVALAVAERGRGGGGGGVAGGGGGARDDHVGPIAAAREEGVVAYLQKEILPYFKLGHRNLNYIQGGPERKAPNLSL